MFEKTSIYKEFFKITGYELNQEQQVILTRKSIEFIFKFFPSPTTVINKFFQELKIPAAKYKVYRSDVLDRTEYFLMIKAWIFYCWKRKKTSDKQIIKQAKKFKIKKRDLILGKHFLNDQEFLKLLKPYNKYKAYDINEIRSQINSVCNTLAGYIWHRASNKLYFVIRNPFSGRNIQDYQTSLKIVCIKAFSCRYPKFDSLKHAINFCRSSIDNIVANEGKKYGRDKHKLLFKNNDGTFESVVASLAEGDDIEQDFKNDEKSMFHMLYKDLKKKYKNNKEKRVMLNTIFGKHDKQFSKYLHKNASNRYKLPNEELWRKDYSRCEKYLLAFLNITPKKLNKFKHTLQNKIT